MVFQKRVVWTKLDIKFLLLRQYVEKTHTNYTTIGFSSKNITVLIWTIYCFMCLIYGAENSTQE